MPASLLGLRVGQGKEETGWGNTVGLRWLSTRWLSCGGRHQPPWATSLDILLRVGSVFSLSEEPQINTLPSALLAPAPVPLLCPQGSWWAVTLRSAVGVAPLSQGVVFHPLCLQSWQSA